MVRVPNRVYEITIQIAEQCVQSNAKCNMYELARSINTQTNNNYYKAAQSSTSRETGMYTVVRHAYTYAKKVHGIQKADLLKQAYRKRNGSPVI